MSDRTIRPGLAALAAALALAGCADMSGIEAQSALRDAQAMGLPAQGESAFALSAEWWRAFGDEQLAGFTHYPVDGRRTAPGQGVGTFRLSCLLFGRLGGFEIKCNRTKNLSRVVPQIAG